MPTKIADIYAEAEWRNAVDEAVEKVASTYGTNLPFGYPEALVKEALLAGIGKSVISGASRVVGKAVPHMGLKTLQGVDKGLNWALAHPRTVGGAATAGAAALTGGAGFLAGRAGRKK